jgi:hypothetical protein
MSARYIFLWPVRVDLVLNLIVFLSNGQDSSAMDGAIRKTQFGEDDAQLVPGKIRKVKKQEQADQNQDEALEERSRSGLRSALCVRHRLGKS